MTAVDFLLTLAAGRLVIWLFMFNGITTRLKKKIKNSITSEFLECDLCVGFWIFLIVISFSKSIGIFSNVVIDNVVSAAAMSMLAHLLRVGYVAQYSVIRYE